jgi:polyhydroxybutyrate depolymerase
MDDLRHARRHLPPTVLALLALLSLPARADLAPSTQCVGSRRGVSDPVESVCFEMQHAGRIRTARIHTGRDVPEAAALIFVLHGGGGSGSGMELLTAGAFNRIADRDGALVAYPDGVERHWNDGRDLPETAVRENVDDVGFMLALVEELARRQALDRGRVFATGISNGGFMSMRLACDAATTFAAVAAVTAVLSKNLGARCRPARPVGVALINGTEDPLVPWSGGTIRVLGVARGEVWSAARTFERWLEFDQCRGRSSDAPVDQVAGDNTVLVLHRGTSCAGAQVRLYEIQGGGHTWPIGVAYDNERRVGRVSRELDATEEIWKFMSANARAGAGVESR